MRTEQKSNLIDIYANTPPPPTPVSPFNNTQQIVKTIWIESEDN